MAIERKFEIVEEDDPNRCQATHFKGQCRNKAAEGSKYCLMHGGNKAVEATKKRLISQYHLAQWQQSRVDDFADHEQVKSLRDEIAISRMLLETILNKSRDADDLLLYSSKISDLISKIEKLVTSCNRLETNMGMLMDKSAALSLAGQMVDIIGKYIVDPTICDQIASEFAIVIAGLKGAEVKGT